MVDRTVVSEKQRAIFFERYRLIREEGASIQDLCTFFSLSRYALYRKLYGQDEIRKSDYDRMMNITEDDYSSFRWANSEQREEFWKMCRILFELGIPKKKLANELGLCDNYFFLKREEPVHILRETYYRLKDMCDSDLSLCFTYISEEEEKRFFALVDNAKACGIGPSFVARYCKYSTATVCKYFGRKKCKYRTKVVKEISEKIKELIPEENTLLISSLMVETLMRYGYTNLEISKCTGIHESTISMVRSGVRKPSFKNANKIYELYKECITDEYGVFKPDTPEVKQFVDLFRLGKNLKYLNVHESSLELYVTGKYPIPRDLLRLAGVEVDKEFLSEKEETEFYTHMDNFMRRGGKLIDVSLQVGESKRYLYKVQSRAVKVNKELGRRLNEIFLNQ